MDNSLNQIESLYGRINPKEMGSNAQREKPFISGKNTTKVIGYSPFQKPKASNTPLPSSIQTLYRPSNKDSRQIWEYLISLMSRIMKSFNPSSDLIIEAADQVLEAMKLKEEDSTIKDLDRKIMLEEILNISLNEDLFGQIQNLTRRINDYSKSSSNSKRKGEASRLGIGIATNQSEQQILEEASSSAVAVVFEESEGEELEELIEEEAAIEIEEEEGITSYSFDNNQSAIGNINDNDNHDTDDNLLNLDALAFDEGSHIMTNRKCIVPQGSVKTSHPGYEEINIPPPNPPSVEIPLVSTSIFPDWCRGAFAGIELLNPIQSVVASCAFNKDDNFLLCAPTGAGKTNVALMAILRALGQRRGRIVYVAPMKALVQEMVRTFSQRLDSYRVVELTGDVQISSKELQSIDIIITTPEKWDIITRKKVDQGLALIIIDEIHLLHDMRGPVLEALISRVKRYCPDTRIVGLSATLPNYKDVARHLGINQDSNIFFFDGSFRPCPLRQSYIGVKERKPLKRMKLINDILYGKVVERAGKHQIIIFVHSRRDTITTARYIRDQSVSDGSIGKFLMQSSSSRQILQDATVQNVALKELIIYGFAIHHAGMNRQDRTLVESLFAQGHVQLLVSTATLAWGVNLPAHTVIIKGTELYSPERGGWIQLSSQDVLQMLGRAGRPQYDIEGEGIILTTHEQVQFYLSLMNQQLPIESQMINKLPEHLNAEIVLNHVKSLNDVIDWIKSLYLYIRMQCEPAIYGNVDLNKLALTVISILEKTNLINYDRHHFKISPTNLGRIASHYYITPQAIDVYADHLRDEMDEMDILHVFSLSPEFKQLTVRMEEKLELSQLADRVPIPIKNASNVEASTKINVLLQTYISRLKLDGFALMADMSYIVQSAGRLFRALMMIAIQKGWSYVAKRSLDFGKMIYHRQWLAQSPIRQMSFLRNENNIIGDDILRRLERKEFSWSHLFDLEPSELGELIRNPRAGRELWQILKSFPRIELQLIALPITRNIMRIECNIMPIWTFDSRIHRPVEIFWIFVEDSDGTHLLYQDQIFIKSNKRTISEGKEEISYSFTIDIGQNSPHHPVLFVHVYSDRWIGSECHVPIVLNKFIPPAAPSEPTLIEDIEPIQIEYKDNHRELWPIQTATYPIIKNTRESILIAAPEGSGRSLMAYLALKNQINLSLYTLVLACNQLVLKRFLSCFFDKSLSSSSSLPMAKGNYEHDNMLLNKRGFICGTPEEWSHSLSKIDSFTMFIILEVHMIGTGMEGVSFEMTITDIRQKMIDDPNIRMIVTSESLYDSISMSSWLGISQVFNYPPNILPKTIICNENEENIPSNAISIRKSDNDKYSICKHVDYPILININPFKERSMTMASGETMTMIEDDLAINGGMGMEYSISDVKHLTSLNDLVYIKSKEQHIEHYRSFIKMPIPVESHLDHFLGDWILSKLASDSISTKQDVIDLVTWSFLYRRILKNPNYYGMFESGQRALSEHLSVLLERTIEELVELKCLIDHDDQERKEVKEGRNDELMEGIDQRNPKNNGDGHLEIQSLGMIAAWYRIRPATIELFMNNVQVDSNLAHLIELLSYAPELNKYKSSFSSIERYLKEEECIKLPFDSESIPALLIQAHISRINNNMNSNNVDGDSNDKGWKDENITIPHDIDRIFIKLANAMIDIIASNKGWSRPIIQLMELIQMIKRARWDHDPLLSQLFLLNESAIMMEKSLELKETFNSCSVYDLIDNPDLYGKWTRIVGSKVANRIFLYPNYSIDASFITSSSIQVSFSKANDGNNGNDKLTDRKEMINDSKDNNNGNDVMDCKGESCNNGMWFLILDPQDDDSILSIKHIDQIDTHSIINAELELNREMSMGTNVKILCMSDCWIGCDQEITITLEG